LLSYCANIGEVLVGLNSDKSVKRLKGNDRPVNNEKDRKLILESIRYVNEVIIFEEDTPYELIKILKPDLIVKGGDYLPHDVVGYDLCEVRIFDTINGYSSTAVINSLLAKKYYE
jgi:D-beta-D-heptose 7-phosphate kinase/D-beta-D-heptose 1-phosphate adenosyltransferase